MIALLKRLRKVYLNKCIINWENKKYIKFCRDAYAMEGTETSYKRDILVSAHTIEKGLSHRKRKPLFGERVVEKLKNDIEQYVYTYKDKTDSFELEVGVSALEKYKEANLSMKVANTKLIDLSADLEKYNKGYAGVHKVNAEVFFKSASEGFTSFSSGRHSVRLYDYKSLEIEEHELRNCIKIAQNAPSACNRQAVRVYVVSNKELINQICAIQGGCEGFGQNAGALLCVVTDLRYYTLKERRLPIFDAGLFTMNLVYALYEKKLGTCILNASFGKSQEKELKKYVPLMPYELLTGMIAVNKIPDGESIMVAASQRRNTDSIVTFVR